jgi:hypothetical protein
MIEVSVLPLGTALLPVLLESIVFALIDARLTVPDVIIGLGLTAIPVPADMLVTVPVPTTEVHVGLAAGPPVVRT